MEGRMPMGRLRGGISTVNMIAEKIWLLKIEPYFLKASRILQKKIR